MVPPDPPSKDQPSGPDDANRAPFAESQALAPMDFSTFVLSLASSAAVNLGQVPPPDSTEPQVDLDAAKQIIDILGVLEEKTRGNLDEAEQSLLRSLLYDLRVQYVDARKASR